MDNRYNNIIPVWFAMSATFGRSLQAQQVLLKKGIENYVPMRWDVITQSKGRKIKKLVPAISNLIFVCSVWTGIRESMTAMPWLMLQTSPREGRNVPIIVPDRQMEHFIRVTENDGNRPIYLHPSEINLHEGERVEVLGGPFDGVEGIFINSRGKRKKQLIVEIPHIIAAKIVIEEYDLIKVLPR